MQPNILFLMADQLNHRFVPWSGNPIVQAPNLARLAGRGTVFENAYCNYPICAPSRYSMLTGRMPHAIEAWDNAAEMPAHLPTIAHGLASAGYQTILCGKMHFVGPDQLHGFAERLVTDIYPADFAWVPDWRAGPRNAPTGISMKAVIEAGHCLRSLQIDYDDEVEHAAVQKLYDLRRRPSQDPFFLCVSLTHPHSPFTASKEHWDRYEHEAIDMPRVGPLPFEQLDEHSRWLYLSHGRDRDEVTEAHVRNARHAYYGMVSYVDDKIGRLVQLMDTLAFERPTLIVFCADHGEMMGERGMWYKQTFFEDSVRVPMFIGGDAWPSPAKRDARPVSLLDLVPTLLEITDTEDAWPSPLDGQSLLSEDERNPVFSEYSDMGVCAPCRMIRHERFKYWITHGHPAQLFDLQADPLELNNLAGRADYAQVEADLHAKATAGWCPEAIHERVLRSQAERQFIQGTRAALSAEQNWSYQAVRDDHRRFVRGSGDGEGTVATKRLARYPQWERDAAD
ncbi:MAG: choline-sulfatase [Burkholderiaceae bacterium]